MATLESLPADQKAVVQLLLAQGRSYEEIAGLLKIAPDAVQARARGALAALGPEDSGLTAERRDEIADFLLGQLGEDEDFATRAFLAGSASGRAWARVVAAELRPVAGDALPEIPEGAEPAPAKAAPAAAAPPAAAAAAPPPEPAPAAGHVPDVTAETSTPIPGPRSSRRGGILLLTGAALVVAIVLIVVFVVGGGGGSKKKTAAKATPAKTSTTPATVIGQANLVPPGGKGNGKRLGVVQIVSQGGQLRIRAVAQGLPAPPKNAGWGVWFTTPGKNQWLGYFQVVTKQGQAIAEGALNVDPSKYKTVLITAEKGKNPTHPSNAVLQGPIQLRNGA
ncbi:MAG TPA: sigma-70 region 4 domain-containing protein [Solirubrobacteraceae bacterium]|nr:sigma-70 region 4 domain-containing protein [Solirubrobacteraceae bacterium]